MTGTLITFEGVEGAGKSTLLEKIDEYLDCEGYQIVRTREPGGTGFGEALRNIVLNPEYNNLSEIAELYLMQASRAQLVKEIVNPALKQNKIVLIDRFYDSSIAYQGVARNIGFDRVHELSLQATQGLKPDLTIILDLDPKIGKLRQHSIPDRMEQEQQLFHKKVREGYKQIASKFPERAVLIDASKTPEQVYYNTRTQLAIKLNL